MLCSAYDAGWVPEPDNVLIELGEEAEVGQAAPSAAPSVRAALCGRASQRRSLQPRPQQQPASLQFSQSAVRTHGRVGGP